MATPASLARPNGPTRLNVGNDANDTVDHAVQGVSDAQTPPRQPAQPPASSTLLVEVIKPPALVALEGIAGAAVQFQTRVPPSGQLTVLSGRQSVSLRESMAGRLVTIWADLRSVHVSVDGHVVRTLASRLRSEDLRHLAMRGARPVGPPPAKPAPRRRNGTLILTEHRAVQIERTVTKDGRVSIAGHTHLVGFAWAGRKIVLRLDGHLMHAVADNALIGSWRCPLGTDRLAGIHGARTPSTRLPPPPLPAGSPRAQRKVHASGRILVAGQRIKLGPRHRGKVVTVVIQDTHLRVLHGEKEIAVRPRRSLKPITRLHVTGAGVNPAKRQASPDDKTSTKS